MPGFFALRTARLSFAAVSAGKLILGMGDSPYTSDEQLVCSHQDRWAKYACHHSQKEQLVARIAEQPSATNRSRQ
jgi:hypothetical protein